MQETQVRPFEGEYPRREMATHYSSFARSIPLNAGSSAGSAVRAGGLKAHTRLFSRITSPVPAAPAEFCENCLRTAPNSPQGRFAGRYKMSEQPLKIHHNGASHSLGRIGNFTSQKFQATL